MRITNIRDALKFTYFPVTYMKNRYPKAARKRRVIKKWETRFGKDPDLNDLLKSANQWNAFIEASMPWNHTGVLEFPIFSEELDD